MLRYDPNLSPKQLEKFVADRCKAHGEVLLVKIAREGRGRSVAEVFMTSDSAAYRAASAFGGTPFFASARIVLQPDAPAR